jgi:hypothetical protein
MFSSAKQFFDHLCTVSRNGGFPSYGEKPSGRMDCLYRGPEGRKCVAGHCIPDDKYAPELEGRAADSDCLVGKLILPAGVSPREMYEAQKPTTSKARTR